VRHFLTKVRGQFDAFQGTVQMDPQHPETGAVEFAIDAKSIDTDSPKRDEHLRTPDFFDVANHPQITFKSHKVVPLAGGRFAVAGTLTMRGVAREVTLPVDVLGTTKDPWGNVPRRLRYRADAQPQGLRHQLEQGARRGRLRARRRRRDRHPARSGASEAAGGALSRLPTGRSTTTHAGGSMSDAWG
jgi:polyisoprenoid-binding protein YceI